MKISAITQYSIWLILLIKGVISDVYVIPYSWPSLKLDYREAHESKYLQ